jgi:hypothetical protein
VADKEATLKLTLKADGFKAGLTDAEKAAKKAGEGMGKALNKGLSDAGKAGIDAMKGSLLNLKAAVTGIAGIAGGFGLVEFAKRAIASESSFRKLAFQIRAGTGEMANWRDMQREAQATALKFGHTTEDVGKSISDLYAAVGDPKFAKEASKVVAEFATGAHEPLEVMTNLAGGLNEKFGVTAKELPDVLASVVSLGNKGGVSVADLADKIGIIGANARVAGLDGAKGFGTMVSWLNVADNATGTLKKGIGGVSGIIDSIATGSIKSPLMKLGIDLDGMKKKGADFNQIVGEIFRKTGGKESKLSQIFSGDQLKVISELGRTYAAAFEETKGDVKTKTRAGLDAYDAALKEAGKSQLDANEIRKEAAAEMETPEKKIATALEKLAQTFTSEKFSAAFKKLAEFIPDVIDTMMKHPLLTGALLSGVPQAIAGSLGGSLMKALGAAIEGTKFGKGAGGAALPILAAAGGATAAGMAIIDAKLEEDTRRQDRTRMSAIGADDMLTNSRGMRGDRTQFAQLADVSAEQTKDLERRHRLASQMIFGGRAGEGPDALAYKQAREALPGGSEADLQEWAQEAIKQGMADRKNLGILKQALDDSRQATANFRGRALGTYGALDTSSSLMGEAGFNPGGASDVVGMKLHGVQDEEYGLGLGGPIKTNRQRAAEAVAAKEEARVAQQKQDFAGLAQGIGDAVGSKTLSVNIVESIPLKTDGGAPPTPGSRPR